MLVSEVVPDEVIVVVAEEVKVVVVSVVVGDVVAVVVGVVISHFANAPPDRISSIIAFNASATSGHRS